MSRMRDETLARGDDATIAIGYTRTCTRTRTHTHTHTHTHTFPLFSFYIYSMMMIIIIKRLQEEERTPSAAFGASMDL